MRSIDGKNEGIVEKSADNNSTTKSTTNTSVRITVGYFITQIFQLKGFFFQKKLKADNNKDF